MPDDGVVPFFIVIMVIWGKRSLEMTFSINISLSIPDNVIRG